MTVLSIWPIMKDAYENMSQIQFRNKAVRRKKKISAHLNLKNKAGFVKENGRYFFDMWGTYAYLSHSLRIPADDGEISINEIIKTEGEEYRKIRMLHLLRQNKKEEAWLVGCGLDENKPWQVDDDAKRILKGVIAFRANPHIEDLIPKMPVAIEYLKYWNI